MQKGKYGLVLGERSTRNNNTVKVIAAQRLKITGNGERPYGKNDWVNIGSGLPLKFSLMYFSKTNELVEIIIPAVRYCAKRAASDM
jgi:hypothetical protein